MMWRGSSACALAADVWRNGLQRLAVRIGERRQHGQPLVGHRHVCLQLAAPVRRQPNHLCAANRKVSLPEWVFTTM